MSELTLQVKGLPEVLDALQAVEDAFEVKWINNALRAGVVTIQKGIAPNVPRLSGNLASTLRYSRDRGHGGATVRDYAVVIGKHRAAGDPYWGRFVELGTQPHEIPARPGGFLHWGSLFSTMIQHPGSKPEPFMEQGLEQYASAATDAFVGYLRNKLDLRDVATALADTN